MSCGIASSAAGGSTTRSTVTAIPSTVDGHERPASSVSRSGAAGSSSCSTDVRCHGCGRAAARTDGSSWAARPGSVRSISCVRTSANTRTGPSQPASATWLLDLADGLGQRGQVRRATGRQSRSHGRIRVGTWASTGTFTRASGASCASPVRSGTGTDPIAHPFRRRGLPHRDLRNPPPRPSPARPRRRGALAPTLVVLGVLVVVVLILAQFWTEVLWFDAARLRQRDPDRVGHARRPVRRRVPRHGRRRLLEPVPRLPVAPDLRAVDAGAGDPRPVPRGDRAAAPGRA